MPAQAVLCIYLLHWLAGEPYAIHSCVVRCSVPWELDPVQASLASAEEAGRPWVARSVAGAQKAEMFQCVAWLGFSPHAPRKVDDIGSFNFPRPRCSGALAMQDSYDSSPDPESDCMHGLDACLLVPNVDKPKGLKRHWQTKYAKGGVGQGGDPKGQDQNKGWDLPAAASCR